MLNTFIFRHKSVLLGLVACFISSSHLAAEEEDVWITIDRDALVASQIFGVKHTITAEDYMSSDDFIVNDESGENNIDINENIIAVSIKAADLDQLSLMMHHQFKRCGGFRIHSSKADALETFASQDAIQLQATIPAQLSQGKFVRSAAQLVQANRIDGVIKNLSTKFHNRYYQSQSGVDAAHWIRDQWKSIGKEHSNVQVKLYPHQNWKQPSVVATIKGTEKPEEIIIIGGHLDTINVKNFNRVLAKAPGADDNASGIATVTEIYRILLANHFKPKRTIQFMGYAAEEVGLKGSREIAAKYKSKGKKVVGVLQLDMVNYNSTDGTIALLTDYTNPELTAFMRSLLKSYFPEIRYVDQTCGYSCSDHASWHEQGYPAANAFESRMRNINPYIHTEKDTRLILGNNAEHAAKFARLGVAFAAELANQ